MYTADLVGKIMDWENGQLDAEQEAEFFQELLDTCTIYHLQGMYGRRMQQLIEAGLVKAGKR